MKLRTNHIVVLVMVLIAAGVLIVIVEGSRSMDASTATTSDSDAFIADVHRRAQSAAGTSEAGTAPPIDADNSLVPVIDVPTLSFDAGTVANDRTTTRTMPIRNVGRAKLEIQNITTTCGCTQGRVDATVVPPGGETTLNIAIDPYRIAGFESTKTLTIYHNDIRTGPISIDVHATVDPEFELVGVEDTTLELGELVKGVRTERTLIWRNLQETSHQLRDARPFGAAEGLEVRFEPRPEAEWQTPGHEEYNVHVAVTEDAPSGPYLRRVALLTTFDRLDRYIFTVQGRVAGNYTFEPNAINLTGTAPGAVHKDAVVIRSEKPFFVVSMTVIGDNPDAFEVFAGAPQGDTVKHFDVRIHKEATPGRKTAQIQFTLNDGEDVSTDVVSLFALIMAPQQG